MSLEEVAQGRIAVGAARGHLAGRRPPRGRRRPRALGVTGGVAAYRAVRAVPPARQGRPAVQVVLTPDAERFVGADDVGGPHAPAGAADDRPAPTDYPHLDAARDAAVVCVAPCSANTLAKLAHGLADNVVTESALAPAGRRWWSRRR